MDANIVLCVGDLVEDVVAELAHLPHIGADTPARVTRRRGGSAANVAAAVVVAGGRARFAGRVGADERGERLVAEVRLDGVEPHVERAGRTGTVVVLVADSERSFLTDRGDAAQLDVIDDDAFADVAWWHLTGYSLRRSPIASAIGRARARHPEVPLSVDASSTTILDEIGPDRFVGLCRELAVSVLFANESEARVLDLLDRDDPPAPIVVVKQGASATVVRTATEWVEVTPRPITGTFDPTGAGDAFAGGFVVACLAGVDVRGAAERGNEVAHQVLCGARRSW